MRNTRVHLLGASMMAMTGVLTAVARSFLPTSIVKMQPMSKKAPLPAKTYSFKGKDYRGSRGHKECARRRTEIAAKRLRIQNGLVLG